GRPLNVTRHAEAQFDLFAVITACQAYPDALHTFISIVVGFHEGSNAVVAVQQLVAEFDRDLPLRPSDRSALVRLLRALPPDAVLAGFEAIVPLDQRDNQPNPRDLPGLVRTLELAFPVG